MSLSRAPASIYVVYDRHGVGVICQSLDEAAQKVDDWTRHFPIQGPYRIATYDLRESDAKIPTAPLRRSG
jgi:hypothetical protein